MQNKEGRGFYQLNSGLARVLKTETRISQAFDPLTTTIPPEFKQYWGIWDTGATNSVVSPKVVAECGLKPVGIVRVQTVGRGDISNIYNVNIVLRNNVMVPFVNVSEGDLGDADVLIGMDIICLGDFAITNKTGKTEFQFRIPSIGWIDSTPPPDSYGTRDMKEQHRRPEDKRISSPKSLRYPNVGRTASCPCGSGKKHKRCCWDKPPEK